LALISAFAVAARGNDNNPRTVMLANRMPSIGGQGWSQDGITVPGDGADLEAAEAATACCALLQCLPLAPYHGFDTRCASRPTLRSAMRS